MMRNILKSPYAVCEQKQVHMFMSFSVFIVPDNKYIEKMGVRVVARACYTCRWWGHGHISISSISALSFIFFSSSISCFPLLALLSLFSLFLGDD